MIYCNFPRGVVQNNKKSQIVELWYASRLSVFIGFNKKIGFGPLLPISKTFS